MHPEAASTTSTARFAFRARRRGLRFECRLDRGRWSRCTTPRTYTGLGVGRHRFSVRSARARRHGRPSSYRWTQFEPRPFSIEPHLGGVPSLFPGAGPVSLPVTLVNPNPMPIQVTSLGVAITADIPGCGAATNFESLPSSASLAAPVTVPAEGSIELPNATTTAPAIGLRDLPFNQDACQGAELPLRFSGEAHG